MNYDYTLIDLPFQHHEKPEPRFDVWTGVPDPRHLQRMFQAVTYLVAPGWFKGHSSHHEFYLGNWC